ncbi:tetratricopeptide repeat protein, partial [Amylibacter sp.]|nr:tetratricopeptide repeat protein [Amylibacter sp.]
MAKLTINQVLQQAVDAHKAGQLQKAHRLYAAILKAQPKHPDANHNTGLLTVGFGKIELALPFFKTALEASPSNAQFWHSHIVALIKLERLIDAKAFLAQAKSKGIKGADFDQLEQRLNDENKALTIKPNNADVYCNMGIAFQKQSKLEEAIEAYNKALSIKPDYAEAYNNMGIAFKSQGMLEEAIEAYNKALSIKPDYADAYYNMGNAFKGQCKPEEAIEAYNKALTIKANNEDSYFNMGKAFQEQSKSEEAIEAYNKALSIKPDYEAARTENLHQQALICDWDSIEENVNLIPELGTSEKHVPPFIFLPLEDSPDRHLTRSKIYSKANHPQKTLPPKDKPSKRPKRIRIGYFSADFKEHPVAYLIAKVLEQHNRDQFEVFGYSVYGSSSCAMRQRLEKSFDTFTDVESMIDRDIALQARQDKIDIAIDLNGYTKHNRTGIFAYRAAPIQINYLGYPGTLGADFMDYIVADRFLIPRENKKYFNEKPLYLPDVYLPTDNTLLFSNEPSSRSVLGLPDSGLVFCAINNSYKINSHVFDIWMRILRSISGSVLWLLESNEFMKANLIKVANNCGVTSDRLVFAQRVSHEKYLSQFQQADLFLDTFPYNAGATASNALWAGLPIITKTGKN